MNCEDCYYQDEITGACTNDLEECVDGSLFVRQLGPDDMFKTLYMLIYNLGGTIEVAAEELELKEEIRIEHQYDPETRKYILTTNPQPPKTIMIKVPKNILKPKKKLIVPGMN